MINAIIENGQRGRVEGSLTSTHSMHMHPVLDRYHTVTDQAGSPQDIMHILAERRAQASTTRVPTQRGQLPKSCMHRSLAPARMCCVFRCSAGCSGWHPTSVAAGCTSKLARCRWQLLSFPLRSCRRAAEGLAALEQAGPVPCRWAAGPQGAGSHVCLVSAVRAQQILGCQVAQLQVHLTHMLPHAHLVDPPLLQPPQALPLQAGQQL